MLSHSYVIWDPTQRTQLHRITYYFKSFRNVGLIMAFFWTWIKFGCVWWNCNRLCVFYRGFNVKTGGIYNYHCAGQKAAYTEHCAHSYKYSGSILLTQFQDTKYSLLVKERGSEVQTGHWRCICDPIPFLAVLSTNAKKKMTFWVYARSYVKDISMFRHIHTSSSGLIPKCHQ